MSWFQLDPQSITQRTLASGDVPDVPSLSTSLWRGIIGFTLVSIAGFAPWALAGRWFYRAIGEAGLYVVCALVFIVLSGLLLHRLIIGPGSLGRFYKLFGLAFTVYSIGWMVGWMMLRGHVGSIIGLFVGTALMGWMLARAFDAMSNAMKIIVILFVFNSLGYFIGGWLEGGLLGVNETVAQLSWGVCYGIGYGAGLGLAFYYCQEKARALITNEQDNSLSS